MSAPEQWWLCPNEPRCPHGAILHDIDEWDDPAPICCADGCACPAVPVPQPPGDTMNETQGTYPRQEAGMNALERLAEAMFEDATYRDPAACSWQEYAGKAWYRAAAQRYVTGDRSDIIMREAATAWRRVFGAAPVPQPQETP